MREDQAKRRRPEGTNARQDESLSRDQRIARSAEFRAVMSAGSRGVSPCLVAVRRTGITGSAPSRLGVVASRKIGGAVRRSRAKRLLREVYRRGERPAGDLILIARHGIGEASWPDLERAYRSAVRMATGRGRPRRRSGRQA
ncbi:MAG: ribonuclease P protein component [Acidobacteriota bacterium]|nr:ribonuclease P protein component [Acidobacteriota bacterium]MDE2712516.1 ribonuclease P protein component [Acidobacteriota bacterium]MXW70888.1 ribonuclease P protein component [Acidobacteriota bacterium]MXX85775.1 ribonuclease P protein component [Acidobacteriota bacterium]MYE44291.1 ribonuclease P protein component [Acidobacteriota bacterium]